MNMIKTGLQTLNGNQVQHATEYCLHSSPSFSQIILQCIACITHHNPPMINILTAIVNIPHHYSPPSPTQCSALQGRDININNVLHH